ncbi:zinc-binding dehydrogenase [Flavitalea flava]
MKTAWHWVKIRRHLYARENVVKRVFSETKDGVDVAIEAVGLPATFETCQKIVRPGGGHIANIGVHRHPVDLQIQDLWTRNITITMGLINTNTTSKLLKQFYPGI